MGEIRKKINWFTEFYALSKAKGGIKWYRISYFIRSSKGRKRIIRFLKKGFGYFISKLTGKQQDRIEDYSEWISVNEPSINELNRRFNELVKSGTTYGFSILISDIHDKEKVQRTINNLSSQLYKEFEVLVPIQQGLDNDIMNVLGRFEFVKTIEVASGLNNAEKLNKLLAVAEKDYFLSIDPGTLLSSFSFISFAEYLTESKELEFFYTDHDWLEGGERKNPYFKPDWSPQHFLSNNYIGDSFVCKVASAKKIGGYSSDFVVNHSYDFLLRITDELSNVGHLAEIGFHFNCEEDDENYINFKVKEGLTALKERSKRQKDGGKVKIKSLLDQTYSYWFEVKGEPKVSIIIPSKDKAELCNVVLSSIFSKTIYTNFEVILISNNSSEQSFFEMATKWNNKEPARFKFIEDGGAFNFSRLMNKAVRASDGDHIVLLNNDTEIIEGNWIELMLGYSQLQDVGVVGVKLLYPNDMIQHAGVIVGLGGVANHCFVGLNRYDKGYFNRVQTNCNYSALTAACFMISSKIYNQCEGFDEKLAVEFNDVDFCLKVKRAGFNNVYLSDVEVYHYESISRGHPHSNRVSFKRSMFEADYFTSKWEDYIYNDPCYNKNLTNVFNDFSLNVGD